MVVVNLLCSFGLMVVCLFFCNLLSWLKMYTGEDGGSTRVTRSWIEVV